MSVKDLVAGKYIQFLNGTNSAVGKGIILENGPVFPLIKDVEVSPEGLLTKMLFDEELADLSFLTTYNGTDGKEMSKRVNYVSGYLVGDFTYESYVIKTDELKDVDLFNSSSVTEFANRYYRSDKYKVSTVHLLSTLWSICYSSPYQRGVQPKMGELLDNREDLIESLLDWQKGDISFQIKALKFTHRVVPISHRLLQEPEVNRIASRLDDHGDVHKALDEISYFILGRIMNKNQRLLASDSLDIPYGNFKRGVTTIGDAFGGDLLSSMQMEVIMELALRIWLTK